MKITVVGTGYVGLVSGTCFAEFGVTVVCVDNNKEKIKKLKKGIIPIFEPGLKDLVKKNLKEKRLFFQTSLSESLKDSEAVFIAVGTPSRRGDGHADLSYVYSAAKDIAKNLNKYAVIVNKSTVPIGTGKKVFDIIKKIKPKLEFDVASNPEFLREGSAINDFMRPDRVVIGCETKRAQDILKELYRPLYLLETPILFTKRETAELIKYAANSFLATKITFINEIADLCEKVGANVSDVSTGIGLDGRIGKKFLHPGPGYGGSCFPKDTLALVKTAQDYKSPLTLIEHVVESNKKRKRSMYKRITNIIPRDKKKKTISVLGLTFKPNTDDMRDSPSLDIIPALIKQNYEVRVFDPEGMEEAKKSLIKYKSKIIWCKNAYEAALNADVLVILTEWNEFRALDLKKLKKLLKRNVIVDLRNIYNPIEIRENGFEYYSVGRVL